MKTGIGELAIFGGEPAFESLLHVGRPNIGDRARLMRRIEDILDRKWLTNNGPYVKEFEQKIAEMLGVRHCIAVCNATIGLELAIRALDLSGEVIVPSFTFIATAHALQWQGITPVFCDIDPRTHNLDPERVEELINPRVSGILAVHLWGRPCAPEALTRIAQRHHLRLLFDAAHAFGCSHAGTPIGSFGDIEVFSFHATKFVNSFEGGAIVTNDDAIAGRLRLMQNFGFAGYDDVAYLGTNGKMNEVSAAMGLTSLESMDDVIAINRRNYEQYRQELAGIKGVRLTQFDAAEKNNFQYIVLEIDEAAAGMTRDEILQILHAENVIARRYFYPGCHRMEPYRSSGPIFNGVLPATEALVHRVLSLPTGSAMGSREIAETCALIRLVTASAAEVRRKMRAGRNVGASQHNHA